MLYYVKRAVGTSADREHLKLENKPKFINEREWRYISRKARMEFATKTEVQDNLCTKLSERTKDEKLKLQPNNIKYIIVKSEKERINIINEILRIFEKEENDCINLLISKVCSSEQMKEDY